MAVQTNLSSYNPRPGIYSAPISTACLIFLFFLMSHNCSTRANFNLDNLATQENITFDDVKDKSSVNHPDSNQDTNWEKLRTPYQPECTSSSDCKEDEVCNCIGKCVEKGSSDCQEDKNCGSGKYCDPCSFQCLPKKKLCEPCLSENVYHPMLKSKIPVGNQCEGEGSRCLDYESGGSYCGLVCLTDAGCPPGFKCMNLESIGINQRQCVPLTGRCDQIMECKQDKDCEFGYICNDDYICVKGCSSDSECPKDKICSAFRCTDKCDPINNPCEEGQICDENGHCKIPGGCIDAYDCLEPETYCDPDTHKCMPGCLTDIDCKQSSKKCEDGVCVEKGCIGNYSCSFGKVCDKETGTCVDPPEPFCKPDCKDDSECGEPPAKCLNLQDQDGNDKGAYCFPPCYDDPDNKCPQGYQCVEIQDQNQNPIELCVRACYEEPVGFF